MKISTKGRYALRLMIDVAIHQNEGYVAPAGCGTAAGNLCQISGADCRNAQQGRNASQRAGTSGRVSPGKGTGVVYGGQYPAADGGDLAPVACLAGEEKRCERSDACATLDFWTGLYAAVNAYVDRFTLADLVGSELEKIQQSSQ